MEGARQIEQDETITAIATPPGIGGIGVVRISGIGAAAIAEELLGSVPPPRVAQLYPFRDGKRQVIDQGLALFFKGPGSYTGEDILELHGHGGPFVLDLLLARVTDLGARMARPGRIYRAGVLKWQVGSGAGRSRCRSYREPDPRRSAGRDAVSRGHIFEGD